MASDLSFVEFVVDQMDSSHPITFRKMFGEYTLYSNEKVVALVCDNRLFVKPTEAGRAFVGEVVEASPYPGAKPAILVEDRIEDGDWLTELIEITERELPKPKPKKKRTKRS